MAKRRVIIVANGSLTDPSYYRCIVRDDDFIIAVNGGTKNLFEMGLTPDTVVGDLDSLSAAELKRLNDLDISCEKHPPEKDKSDLELALEKAILMRPGEIVLFCALGGKRADHLFNNLLLLFLPLSHKIKARVFDESGEARLFDSDIVIEGSPGDYLSLFALSSVVKGVTTRGLKYPLCNEQLNLSSSRGLSNEFTAEKAEIKIQEGLLLAIKTFRSVL